MFYREVISYIQREIAAAGCEVNGMLSRLEWREHEPDAVGNRRPETIIGSEVLLRIGNVGAIRIGFPWRAGRRKVFGSVDTDQCERRAEER